MGTARTLCSGQIAAATKAARRRSQPGWRVTASQARSTSSWARLRAPVTLSFAKIRHGAGRVGRPLFEGGGIGRKQVAVPAQLGRKAAERAQELHVEPGAGD